MTTELYKKHRPSTLSTIVGANSTVAALTNMLARGTLPHTLLFQGPSGCGKTTLARILRHELKCHDADFKELNCSSFRGIDTIREIARIMNLAAIGGKVRIWLLDEVHQLSKDGQNAALKILEDTPKHVYFFLCTTEPQKLIKTIRTRCTDMPVYDLTYKELERLVKRVVRKEKKSLCEEVMDEIISSAQGSARTALVLLDKVLWLNEEQQLKAVALASEENNDVMALSRALFQGDDWRKIAGILRNLTAEPETIRYNVLGYARAVLLKGNNDRAYTMILAFADNFYDSKKAGVIGACYEVVFGL